MRKTITDRASLFADATLDDLMRHEGIAELIAGKVVPRKPLGRRPALIVGRIAASLQNCAESTPFGEVFTGGVGYAVEHLPTGRKSFSPSVSYHTGPFPDDDMDFIPSAPEFAVEVRGIDDYGTYAEREMELKRRDYFLAGTKVVWDVDPIDNVILSYSTDDPENPRRFVPGDTADAEPAVPGWRLDVAAILR